ncbi:hypothetical protein V501_07586 [Pseudogymnoascus sp. VKM F-4519 (FW-2642)]|nr:hypothetical protein V501_07586 [Pseudogymnoascus sp. VKM F-4519 (FW-2642)]
MSSIVAVIGTSRGIGLELVKQLSLSANTRTPSPESHLKDDNIKMIALDMTDDASVIAAAMNVRELDTLIINAPIGNDDHLQSLSSLDFISYLNTNVVGRVIRAFLPALLVRNTRQIVITSPEAGSHQLQIGSTFGLVGPFGASKVEVNMLAV